MATALILDVDGTLVDSNYQHAIAWFRAFRSFDLTVPIWRIHRHIGMGGDQLVTAVAGDEAERRHGDELREAEGERFDELIAEVQPFEGAHDLLVELGDRGHPMVLASSASESDVRRFIDLIDAAELIEGYTASDDVDHTKPEPDLIEVAMEKSGQHSALMVGDSTWDIRAAKRAGLETAGVLTGGFAESELREEGAVAVFHSLVALREGLDDLSQLSGG